MQDEHIGKHCQICNRKDYIPYNCKKCHAILCDEHYWAHPCVANQYQPKPPPSKPDTHKAAQYHCSLDSCKKPLYTVNHYYCPKCDRLFCLSHRIPEEHKCKSVTEKQEKCQII